MNSVDEVVAECLFRVARRRAVLRRAKQGAKESASIDVYDAWRRQSLEVEFTRLFDPCSIAGKHVLDFGCGSGALTLIISRLGATSICGVDLDAKAVGRATVYSKMVDLPDFAPPYWDFDEQGNRRDRFAEAPKSSFLNHLTIAKFERLCARHGLRFARREFHTFRALKTFPFVETVLALPGLREFFSSYAVYELAAS
jgi:hypothetical protein